MQVRYVKIMRRNLAIMQNNEACKDAISIPGKTLRNGFHNLSDCGTHVCPDSNVVVYFDRTHLVL